MKDLPCLQTYLLVIGDAHRARAVASVWSNATFGAQFSFLTFRHISYVEMLLTHDTIVGEFFFFFFGAVLAKPVVLPVISATFSFSANATFFIGKPVGSISGVGVKVLAFNLHSAIGAIVFLTFFVCASSIAQTLTLFAGGVLFLLRLCSSHL